MLRFHGLLHANWTWHEYQKTLVHKWKIHLTTPGLYLFRHATFKRQKICETLRTFLYKSFGPLCAKSGFLATEPFMPVFAWWPSFWLVAAVECHYNSHAYTSTYLPSFFKLPSSLCTEFVHRGKNSNCFPSHPTMPSRQKAVVLLAATTAFSRGHHHCLPILFHYCKETFLSSSANTWSLSRKTNLFAPSVTRNKQQKPPPKAQPSLFMALPKTQPAPIQFGFFQLTKQWIDYEAPQKAAFYEAIAMKESGCPLWKTLQNHQERFQGWKYIEGQGKEAVVYAANKMLHCI